MLHRVGDHLPDDLAPRVRDRHDPELARLEPEATEELGERRPDRAHAAVLRLERDPEAVGAGGAEQTLGSTLRRPALELAHQERVGRHRAADQVRMLAHRGGDPGAAVDLLEAREHQRHPLEREREGDDAAAVDGRRHLVDLDVGGGRDHVAARMLDRVRVEPVAAARPAVGAAEREHAGVLAGAVVLERRRLGAALELSLVGRRLREQAAHGVELLGRGEVRGGGDRDLLRGQVVARASTSGIAWNGFAEERRYATSPASPACSTTAPSRTATAWTTCRLLDDAPRRRPS